MRMKKKDGLEGGSTSKKHVCPNRHLFSDQPGFGRVSMDDHAPDGWGASDVEGKLEGTKKRNPETGAQALLNREPLVERPCRAHSVST